MYYTLCNVLINVINIETLTLRRMKYIYQIHPYHLLTNSPWPLIASVNSLIITIGSILKFNKNSSLALIIGIILLLITVTLWFRDVIRESTFTGYHTNYVRLSIAIGFILFLISEILLFATLFWAYFHSSLTPSVQIGNVWPPVGINTLNQYEIPLTNTILLLSSGCTLTICHNEFISVSVSKRSTSSSGIIMWLTITIGLALIFIALQYVEYINSEFTLTDSVYGSTFFITTGFHGIHVMVGTIFLIINLIRIINNQLTSNHHIGFEFAIAYYHLRRFSVAYPLRSVLQSSLGETLR